MKNTFRTLAVLLVLSGVLSCKSEYEALLSSNDIDAKYEAAFDYFNQKKYSRAAQLFESMSVLTNGTERDDTVQYYWGLSNYRYKDYYTAESNFTKKPISRSSSRTSRGAPSPRMPVSCVSTASTVRPTGTSSTRPRPMPASRPLPSTWQNILRTRPISRPAGK